MKEKNKDLISKYPKGIPSKEIKKEAIPLFENNDCESQSKNLHSEKAMNYAFNCTHFIIK